MSDMKYKVIGNKRAELGESPFWDEQNGVLYWLDILSGKIFDLDPITGQENEITVGKPIGCAALREKGGFVAALEDGFYFITHSEAKWNAEIFEYIENKPGDRFNDGKCDPAGRFWAGTMSKGDKGKAALYVMDINRTVRKAVDGVTVSNGLTWSLDSKIMYYTDTVTSEVWAFDYDLANGRLANKRTAIRVPDGMGLPDGMTIDAEGMLWVALWGGYCVSRWDPDTGSLLCKIDLPVPHTSSCAFGGRNMDELYITSAREGLDEAQLRAQPLSGALFMVKPGVSGVPMFRYKG